MSAGAGETAAPEGDAAKTELPDEREPMEEKHQMEDKASQEGETSSEARNDGVRSVAEDEEKYPGLAGNDGQPAENGTSQDKSPNECSAAESTSDELAEPRESPKECGPSISDTTPDNKSSKQLTSENGANGVQRAKEVDLSTSITDSTSGESSKQGTGEDGAGDDRKVQNSTQATPTPDESSQKSSKHSKHPDPNEATAAPSSDENTLSTGEGLKSGPTTQLKTESSAAETTNTATPAAGARGYEGLIGTESVVTHTAGAKSPQTPNLISSAASLALGDTATPSCSSASAMHRASPAATGVSSLQGRHPLDVETQRMTDKQAHGEAIRLQNASISTMVKCSANIVQFNRASEQNYPAMKTSFDRHSIMLSSLSKDLVTIDIMLQNIRQRMAALGARPLEERKEE